MKKALTISEQIAQLKQRGMLFKDEKEAAYFLKIKKKFLQLISNYPNIPLYKMGFPKDWKEQPIWK